MRSDGGGDPPLPADLALRPSPEQDPSQTSTTTANPDSISLSAHAGPSLPVHSGMPRPGSQAHTLDTMAASYGSVSISHRMDSSSALDVVEELSSSRAAAGAVAAAAAQPAAVIDPDYVVPRGTLTETKVLLLHCQGAKYDCYGFRLPQGQPPPPSSSTKDDTEEWRQARRVAKWSRMLGPDGKQLLEYKSRKFDKLKSRLRKGAPGALRGLVWHVLSGGQALMSSNAPGTYERLQQQQEQSGRSSQDADIMRDLNRTFPTNVYFTDRQGPGQLALYNVLRAYCALNNEVGYVQGMGCIVAVLLLHMPEEQAFWSFVSLMKGASTSSPLEGMFTAGMPTLMCCLHQWQALLSDRAPKLSALLQRNSLEPVTYAVPWFNTLFAYSLNFDYLLRIWDIFMLEGMKVVFRVGVVLAQAYQQQLLASKTTSRDEQLGKPLKSLQPLLPSTPDQLIQAAVETKVSTVLRNALATWNQQQKKK